MNIKEKIMNDSECSTCLHNDVCMFQKDYHRAKVYIANELQENTAHWVTSAAEHFTIDIKCNHYSLLTPTPKNQRLDEKLSTIPKNIGYDSGPGYRAKD